MLSMVVLKLSSKFVKTIPLRLFLLLVVIRQVIIFMNRVQSITKESKLTWVLKIMVLLCLIVISKIPLML